MYSEHRPGDVDLVSNKDVSREVAEYGESTPICLAHDLTQRRHHNLVQASSPKSFTVPFPLTRSSRILKSYIEQAFH